MPARSETTVDEEDIVLRTRSTRHVLRPAPTGTGLVAVTWGPASEETPEAPALPHVPSFSTIEDALPHEYSVAGTRHIRASDLLVAHEDSVTGSAVQLDGEPVLERSAGGDTLRARLREDTGDLAIDLSWETSTQHDVIARRSVVTNISEDRTVTLMRARTGSLNVHVPGGAEVTTLTGEWCDEYRLDTTRLTCGTFSLASRQGITSHRAAPVLTVSETGRKDRGCWSVQLAWSGSWQAEVDLTDEAGWARIAAGACDVENIVRLDPGESFEGPVLLGLWAPDRDAAARAWHRYARLELLRDTSGARRPVTYNSWYATTFDVRIDQQVQLAQQAADLGCEMFVLDDGWFRGRHDEHAGLGDWDPDPHAFPDGLRPLADAVHQLGMRFGLWVEPEGVNPDSDLFRAHPEWIYRVPTRDPVTIRHQFVLDLGRPEVEQWCLQTLRRILSDSGVDHLKWDMNRAVTDGGRPGDPHGAAWAIHHARAYHRLLDTLRDEFPEVSIEGCSGGGGRIDAEVLRRTDVVWTSDETGPRDRLAIQHGFLTAFPAAVNSSWVTHLDGSRDTRPASLTYRACVSMSGVLGLGMDLTTLDATDREQLRTLVAIAKDIRPVVLDGEVHRHGRPGDHGYAVEFAQVEGECTASGGVTDERVVCLVFGEPGADEHVRLRPRFATPASQPRIAVPTAGEARWDGEELRVTLDPEAGAAVVTLQA